MIGFLLRLLLAGLLGWAGTGAAQAQVAPQLPTCVAPLHGQPDEVAALIDQPQRFDCRTRQTAFGPGDFLVRLRFAPLAVAPGDPLVLRMTSVWQQGATVHFRYADGERAALPMTAANGSAFMTVGALFEFPVPYRAAPLTGVFVETRGSANLRGIVLGPTLLTRSAAFSLREWLVALYAGFAGLSLALIVYNLAFWAALGHRFQLNYTAMVAALAAYTFTSSGAAMLVFPGLDNNDRLRLNYLLLGLTAVAGVNFIRRFFGPAVFGPRLERAYAGVAGYVLAISLAFAVLAPWQAQILDRLYFVGALLLLSLVVPIMVSARRAQSPFLGIFLVAWSAPIIASAARTLHGFNLVPYSFWLDNGNLLALSIESLLSSFMITARLRELSSERDSARAGEQSALRLANSDPLTGLLNRRAFMQLATGRTGLFRLMLIDIDRFKAINDRYGHDAGDEVIRLVAQAIQRIRPAESLAVRIGGEEFALLLPRGRAGDCTPDDVLDTVRALAMPLGIRVTVSVGYAEGRIGREADWKRLYRLADAALYRAKADGRDRACRATDFAAAA